MNPKRHALRILTAEDDEDDRLLIKEAFRESNVSDDSLCFVENGDELLDYLYHRRQYANPQSSPRPQLILLDLNMPRKNGREVLKEIKENPSIRSIPVVIFSTSKSQEDIDLAYEMGANSFIVKPARFDELVKTIKLIVAYWFELIELPNKQQDG